MPDTTTARERLTRRRVLEGALLLVDTEGAAALSMRRLAAALGTSPMSLYHHVAGREELLDGLSEIMVGQIGMRFGEEPQAALRRLAHGIRAVALAHPQAFRLVGLRPLRTPSAMTPVEAGLGALRQLGTAAEAVGLERHLRIGPARFALDHKSYRHVTVTPRAVGLRPYAPAHLRMRDDGGTHRFAWVRRTRVGGDGWDAEVPLGEEREVYALRAVAGGATVWEGETAAPAFAFDAAARGAAGIDGAYRMEVAQVGAGYGPGAWAGLPVP